MKRHITIFNRSAIIVLLFLTTMVSACGGDDEDQPVVPVDEPIAVTKTNTTVVYMHYMPWFQSKPVSGYWGSHWKMANKNPDNIDENGKREIAAHYYPLIGPYDSKDPDVIAYHLLLMKYAGVDAVLIDWYSSINVNDYQPLLTASNAIIDHLDDVGLKFAVVYEDYTAGVIGDKTSRTAMEAGQVDMAYLASNYFKRPEYVKFGDAPLLLTFGPRYFKTGAKWTELLSAIEVKPKLLPLWGHGGFTGSNGSGEYAWIDFTPTLSELTSFYNKKSSFEILIGSAFPRFHDYYEEGGQGTSYGYVADNDGQTLLNTLAKATEKNISHLQLATWNDFGEGTVFEPTQEFQFKSLEAIQQFTGVPYDKTELELVYNYYLKKVKYKTDAAATEKLNMAFKHLTRLEVDQAATIINGLD